MNLSEEPEALPDPEEHGPGQEASNAAFEDALAARGSEQYVLCLYVAGTTVQSRRAVASIKQICEDELAGRYDLEVVDIYQHPEAAVGDDVVAAPTLVKRLPAPLRKLIGDLSDRERILVGLELRPRCP